MHKITDFIINILRWPAAFYLLFSVPALLNVYHYFDFGGWGRFYFFLDYNFFIKLYYP